MARGSALFPTIWARVSGLMGRPTHGMFDEREVSINTFVDDPLTVLSGPAARRTRHMAMIILVWRALGFPISFAKGEEGPKVVWIGTTYKLLDAAVECSIKEAILNDSREQIEILKSSGNLVKAKLLKSTTSRANHVAGLLMTWRPFLAQLWAVLSSHDDSAPPGCVWWSRVSSAIL